MFLIRHHVLHDKPRYVAEYRAIGHRRRIRLTDRRSEAATYPTRLAAIDTCDDITHWLQAILRTHGATMTGYLTVWPIGPASRS